jgi:hypothetical protein
MMPKVLYTADASSGLLSSKRDRFCVKKQTGDLLRRPQKRNLCSL